MAIKWKNFSHSIITKIIVFIIVITCFTSSITIFINLMESTQGEIDIVFEDNYYHGEDYIRELDSLTHYLSLLITKYKNKDYILSGKTVTGDLQREKEHLFSEFKKNSNNYNPNWSDDKNYETFERYNADEIFQSKNKLIEEDLKIFDSYLSKLQNLNGILYYASDGENEFTNSPSKSKKYFKNYPAYLIFDKSEEIVFPKEVKTNPKYYNDYLITRNAGRLEKANHTMYIAFIEEPLNDKIKKWEKSKAAITDTLYNVATLLVGLLLAFIYLILVIGRKSFKDNKLYLNFVNRLYNDINIILCLGVIVLWFGAMEFIFIKDIYILIPYITAALGTLGLLLVLSLVKHIKNRTLIKHTLIYNIFNKLFRLICEIYNSGNFTIKILLISIGCPLIIGLSSLMLALLTGAFIPAILVFFIASGAVGVTLWLSFKKTKEFTAIKEGVTMIKEGHVNHVIDISGKGEFAKLADNINSIAEGLSKAVANELKSERLKTELISNVSHDIRTPLTSIITYIDLLKKEGLKSENAEKYIDVLDQKALRLKALTDDLFEASKASSGSIPVNLEEIDVISLIKQGMGELDDKIAASGLDFKLKYPKEKVFVKADGKLLWRVIENLMSNIFKYALNSSRVYIDIIDSDNNVTIIIKNISSYELNINANELMERFKRGDESRNSEGSGLGLSIAKSLIELQNGTFNIEIDGDLFKVVIVLLK
ncbi:HAMP domain-containing sensor histidine kinase [Maledivibacter halophilus]|uniref:histidine kinase n=1 Tax=Maledivibacter halophilus TaxID=36842 RepID=A0A1T5IUN0_9FIRM|nr:sensor histidine kinase [Maledivibacter halophilus]SKC42886.1 Signal transduction histidine kinase [Maledivibacter halophilus]